MMSMHLKSSLIITVTSTQSGLASILQVYFVSAAVTVDSSHVNVWWKMVSSNGGS